MQLPVRLNYRFVFKLSLVYFVIQTFVRVLIVAERAPGIVDTFDAFLDGVIWDLGTWLLVAFPVFVYSIFASDAIHKKFCDSKIETASLFIFTFVLTFIGFCEVVFWKEFHSRFNFIDHSPYSAHVA